MTQSQPIMVTMVESPADATTVADVLLRTIGLIGLLILVAVILGLLLGGALVTWKRLRERHNTAGPRAGAESDAIHISPYLS